MTYNIRQILEYNWKQTLNISVKRWFSGVDVVCNVRHIYNISSSSSRVLIVSIRIRIGEAVLWLSIYTF